MDQGGKTCLASGYVVFLRELTRFADRLDAGCEGEESKEKKYKSVV